MKNEYDIKDFKYVPLSRIDFDIREVIKDDYALRKFIDIGENNSTRVIYYKNTPIGFKYESSYLGSPEFQCAIFKDFRGLGIANYLLNEFRNRKFADNHRRVVLLIDKNNESSIRSATKNGFIMDDSFEELNPDNKETPYYVFYSNNPNYISEHRKRR